MQSIQTCIPFSIKDLQMPFKRCLLTVQRASFTPQKGIFTMQRASFTVPKAHLLFSIYESLLQPFLCPFPFAINKYLSPCIVGQHHKNTCFQFSCHSPSLFPTYNALITKYLCEMLKVTATKTKTNLGFRVIINHIIPKTVSEEICIFPS